MNRHRPLFDALQILLFSEIPIAMRRLSGLRTLPIFGLLVFFSSAARLVAEDIISVAVIDFASPPGSEGKGADVATLMTTLLSNDPGLLLVERAELSKILGEFELNLGGTVDPGAAAKIGHLAGADILVTGRMFQTGDDHFIASKAISVSTGRIFGDLAEYEKGESIAAAAQALSEKVSKRIADNRSILLPAVETNEARLARLAKLIEGKTLPTVYVSIPEEHLSARVPDPAAQTEIQKTLQDLGFQLVDKESAAQATIKGEAFSELGARHANLVSCRARIEVVVKSDTKKDNVKVDRETSVAADLAENIAAKSALQRGGASLAERLIPLLVQEP